MNRRVRGVLLKLGLLAATLLVALLLAEIAVRIVFPDWAPRTGRIVELWQYDRDYGWAHVPGSTGRFESFGFDTLVEINSQGFRGPDVSIEKGPAKRRIVVVGDSYAWGFGVEYDEIFSTRIQQACSDVEVVNLAVSGYSTDQELLLFREKGIAYDPDVVILVMAGNDFESNTRSKEYVYYHKPVFVLEDGELELTNRPVPRANALLRFAASTSKRSYLLTQLNRVFQGIREKGERERRAARRKKEPPRDDVEFPRTPAERITGLLVESFISTVESTGAPLIIVFVDGQGGRDRRLAGYLGETSAALVHVDDYIPSSAYDDYHLPGDFHWNPTGHAIVGDALLDVLLGSGMLPAESCVSAQGQTAVTRSVRSLAAP
jgi:lysophospholipase L1-like esterase